MWSFCFWIVTYNGITKYYCGRWVSTLLAVCEKLLAQMSQCTKINLPEHCSRSVKANLYQKLNLLRRRVGDWRGGSNSTTVMGLKWLKCDLTSHSKNTLFGDIKKRLVCSQMYIGSSNALSHGMLCTTCNSNSNMVTPNSFKISSIFPRILSWLT